MNLTFKHLAVSTIVVVLALGADAQSPPSTRAPKAGAAGRVYDPKTVETVSGEIVAIEHTAGPGGGAGGIHLLLRTDNVATLSVHLGPASYVDKQEFKMATGDRIEVRGSRVTIEERPVIVAAEVRRGQQKLLLRDDVGVPYWSGAHRKTGPQR
jgi:hypothetical protein